MATYKVIQDIEAEDHILGPLSLRQFIFAILAVMCFYFCYLVISKHVAFLSAIFLPPGIFFAFFAFPFGGDQPTEIWALAKIRFLFKPRRRIWDQSGVKELVTVTAPKKVEEHLSNGLSQSEISSRLSALANTIDSRGWAIKNVNVNMYSQPGVLPVDTASDRLVDISSMPQEVPSYDVQAADDIMDGQNNPIAHQFDEMINASAQAHRQQLVGMMNESDPVAQPAPAASQPQTAPTQDYWFLNQPAQPTKLAADQSTFGQTALVTPGADDAQVAEPHAGTPTAEEEALAEQIKAQQSVPEASYAHMKRILPLDQQAKMVPQPAATPVAVPANPAVQKLAGNNDLNIATIAREAERTNHPDEKLGDDEVVISLH